MADMTAQEALVIVQHQLDSLNAQGVAEDEPYRLLCQRCWNELMSEITSSPRPARLRAMSLTQIGVLLTGIWLILIAATEVSDTLTLIAGIAVVALVLLDSPIVRARRV